MTKPNIALVGNVQGEDIQLLNNLLAEEDLGDICTISLYGADGQPEEEALRDAVDDCLCDDAIADGVVCLPMSHNPKKAVTHALDDDSTLLPVIITEKMRYVAATKEDLKEKVQALWECLRRDLSILMPRIAVVTTDDETKALIEEMAKEGKQVFPVTEPTEDPAFDACIVESMTNETEGVTLLTGTRLAVTAATPQNILQAIYIVIDVRRNRQEYDRPLKNPLPKLFHEKKEDGEKARFATKKGFNPAEHKRENVTYIRS